MFTVQEIETITSPIGLLVAGAVIKGIWETWIVHRGENKKNHDDKNAEEIHQETEYRKINMESMARNTESLENQITSLVGRIGQFEASDAISRAQAESERKLRRKAEDETADALAIQHRTQLQLDHEKDRNELLVNKLNDERTQHERDTIALQAEHVGHQTATELGIAVVAHIDEADIRPDVGDI